MQKFSVKDYIAGTTALGKELKITRVAAWKMAESGRIKSVNMGNIILFPMTEVRKLKKIYNPKGIQHLGKRTEN